MVNFLQYFLLMMDRDFEYELIKPRMDVCLVVLSHL